jgi:hypothetical protein
MSGESGGQGIGPSLPIHLPAHSPFHKKLTEKRKDGRLCHLLAEKRNFQSFTLICRKPWLAQFVCAPQFFKTPKGLYGHTVYITDPPKELYHIY